VTAGLLCLLLACAVVAIAVAATIAESAAVPVPALHVKWVVSQLRMLCNAVVQHLCYMHTHDASTRAADVAAATPDAAQSDASALDASLQRIVCVSVAAGGLALADDVVVGGGDVPQQSHLWQLCRTALAAVDGICDVSAELRSAVESPLTSIVNLTWCDGWTAVWNADAAAYYFAHLETVSDSSVACHERSRASMLESQGPRRCSLILSACPLSFYDPVLL
jgi:hypothetical protein